MYRAVGALKGQRSNGSLRRFATSPAVATQSSSGGLLGWLTGSSSSSSLDSPLKDVPVPPVAPDSVEPGKTIITTLPNGFRIASQTSQNPAASVGLYVDSGSIYETPATFGATHVLESLAFKSTKNRSHLRIVREIEAIGGNPNAAASREQMAYTLDGLKTFLPHMVELLIDCVRNPAFLDWEVKEQIHKLKAEIADYSKNPQHLLLENIHSTGYSGPLANSLVASEYALEKINSEVLDDFVAENFTAPRMVLAATGVDHDELVKLAEPLLSDLPNVTRTEELKPVYTGGDFRQPAESGMTHFALAFELPGGWRNIKDSMTMTVLQMLMGGGGSFSAGGPGKGMYSRLYLRVLNEYAQMQSFSAFTSIYNNSGLFGIQAATTADFAPEAVDVACKELIAVATPKQVDQVQLDRAKKATKSAILMTLESRMVASEDIGRQVLTYGERKPVEDFLKLVDEVTADDIKTVVQKLLSSPLTLASHGDVLYFPRYEDVCSRFHSK